MTDNRSEDDFSRFQSIKKLYIRPKIESQINQIYYRGNSADAERMFYQENKGQKYNLDYQSLSGFESIQDEVLHKVVTLLVKANKSSKGVKRNCCQRHPSKILKHILIKTNGIVIQNDLGSLPIG